MAPQRPPRRGNNPPHGSKSKAGGPSRRGGLPRPGGGPPPRFPARVAGAPPQGSGPRPGTSPAKRGAIGPGRQAGGRPGSASGLDRLQKFLAHAGVGSRRACEELILQGRVTVAGQVVRELGTKVDPTSQPVAVDGQRVQVERPVYFAVYKPKGYVSTNNDPSGRPRVLDLLPEIPQRVYTVGRLDEMSVGLMLLTNDGELANQLAHPRFGVEKLYRVAVAGSPTREVLSQLTEGIWLAEGKVRAKRVRAIGKRGDSTILELVLAEGKNREVRRMLAKLGHKVMTLTRVAVGPITIKGLTAGQFRPLTGREVDLLRRVAAGQPVPMPWMNDRRPDREPPRPRRPESAGPAERRPGPPPGPPRRPDGPRPGPGYAVRPSERPSSGPRPGPGGPPRPYDRPYQGPRPGPGGPPRAYNRPNDGPGGPPRPYNRPNNGPGGPPRPYDRPNNGPRPGPRASGPPAGRRGPGDGPPRPSVGLRPFEPMPSPPPQGPAGGRPNGPRPPRPVGSGPTAPRRPGPPPSQEPPRRKVIGMAPEPAPPSVDRPRPRMKRPPGPGKRPAPRPALGSRPTPRRRRDGEGPSE